LDEVVSPFGLFGVVNFPCVHTLEFKVPSFTVIEFQPFSIEPYSFEIWINPNIDNRGSIIIIVPKKKNQIELVSPLTVSIFYFLMETAEETILPNPRRYKNKYQALIS
jgi:hypothetical protein